MGSGRTGKRVERSEPLLCLGDYGDSLRSGCLNHATGFILGVANGGESDGPSVPTIVAFLSCDEHYQASVSYASWVSVPAEGEPFVWIEIAAFDRVSEHLASELGQELFLAVRDAA